MSEYISPPDADDHGTFFFDGIVFDIQLQTQEPYLFTPPYTNNVVIQIAPAVADVRSGNYTITESSSPQSYGPAGQQPDESFAIGYNLGGAGIQKANENGLGVFIESHYVPSLGANAGMEFQIRHIFKDGSQKRPLHIFIDKTTGETSWIEQATTWNLADPITGVSYVSLSSGQWIFSKGATGGLSFFDNTTQWLIRPAGSVAHSLNFSGWNDYYFDVGVHFAQDATVTRNLFINTTATGSGAGVISIGRATTAPTTNPANACILYTDPADNVVKIRDTAGVVHALW